MDGTSVNNNKTRCTSVTLDEAMLLSGFGIYNILHMLMSGLVLMGMIMQCLFLGYVIPAAQCDLELNTFQKGWLSAIPFASVMLTSYFWGWLGDTKGRRPVILYSMIASAVITCISSFAPELGSFAVLQFLAAIFMTGSSAILYTYLGEFNNLRHRDKIITFGSSFIGIGLIVLPCISWIILSQNFAYPIPFLNISYRPRRLLVVATSVPFAIAAVVMLFAPETPKFFYEKGHHEEALYVIKTIYSINTKKAKDSFPVKSLKPKGLTTTETKKTNILTSMQEQTLPLFRSPLLKWTCIICFIQFAIFAGTNGFYIWFPAILNSLASSEANNMTICNILDANRVASNHIAAESNATFQLVCDDSIRTSTFLRSIYIGLIFYSMYIVVGVTVNYVSKKYILLVTLVITGFCGIAAHLVTDVQLGVMLFAIFQMSGVCVGLMNAVAVEVFPTRYRGMGVCLSMMIGRSGSMVGSNLIGWLLEVNCGAGFYIFGGLLIVNGLLCLTLPNNKKIKSTERLEI